ncbi:MAG: hypothetical protein Q9219_001881 [cf. Caloplaca sp. 3 TL-2023]
METMESPKKKVFRPHSRKSIAHMPSPDTTKENATIDSVGSALKLVEARHKSRSKSIGPGGLNPLQEGSGNRREAAAATTVKSILKPTIPLSPPKKIPPHRNQRRSLGSPQKSPHKGPPEKQRLGAQDELLIDISDGVKPNNPSGLAMPNPFGGGSPKQGSALGTMSTSQVQSIVMVRTEEEQQAAKRQREQLEKADAHKDARPSRRVSFAPEATLHTWNVMEVPEDSTTSSTSGNSTRRASALSTMVVSPMPQPQSPGIILDTSEPPATPTAGGEEPSVKESPVQQRDLHQKKRRRSSAIPPMNFNNPEEFSSSPCSGSSVNSDDTGTQTFTTAEEADSSDSDDKDLVEDESTVTGVDRDDMTGQSALSARSNGSSSTNSSARLDEALQQAAKQAGTQGIEYDEHGDITMEMADDEVTNAFQPWVEKGQYVPQIVGHPSALQDQENVNPFSPEFRSRVQAQAANGEQAEQTMDITQAAGSILPSNIIIHTASEKPRRRSSVGGRRQSDSSSRRASLASSTNDDETMELTTAIGGIRYDNGGSRPPQASDTRPEYSDNEDEDLTMEMTTAIGGLLQKTASKQPSPQKQSRRESLESSTNDTDMDITFAAGGILSSITERTEPSEDQTMEMEVTKAIGAILPNPLPTNERTRGKILMERESEIGQLPLDPFFDGTNTISSGKNLDNGVVIPRSSITRASATGSPSPGESAGRPKSFVSKTRQSVTPRMESRQTTPLKVSTPSKQVTPLVGTRPTTPGKTPPSKNVSLRTGSPKKLFEKELSNRVSSPKASVGDIFRNSEKHGVPTPQIILKPRRRRSSGLGVDKDGLGSPRVTELLDRRGSIGQTAQSFVSQSKATAGVRFEDPRVMEQEIEQERAEDERRESGRGILQMEADCQDTEEPKDATANLKGKIESLTPQKKKPKARKSLHVGAARGLLGKRPAELDEDDGDDDLVLKGREGSPVKKIKLPAPPSKDATTRRDVRSARLSLAETMGNARMSTPSMGVSPVKGNAVTTPQGQPRFKDAINHHSAEKPVASFEEKLDAVKPMVVEPSEGEDRIHLQEFLNMTSIRFMELTTTKRRLTVAPNVQEHSANGISDSQEQSKFEAELANSVVAAACTVPMLELYQHSCRELKRYIAEGRSIVREIEADTYEDNPALFREYMTASPDVKTLMDNQFKNVKTHARLLSKAMWYEWRMKLLDGLKEGLVQISDGMDEDAASLSQQEQLLTPVLPKLIEENDRLQNERQILQAQADELASCDQDELREAREKLTNVDTDLQAKKDLLRMLQQDLQAKERDIQDATERRDEYHGEIKEAERVRQESRGWKMSEVTALQGISQPLSLLKDFLLILLTENVTTLEATYGWKIISASGAALTMTYKDTLQLYFTPSAFIAPGSSAADSAAARAAENSPISLTYIADSHEHSPRPLTTELRFFLQIIRAQLQCLRQSRTSTPDLLGFISRNWETALAIAEEVRCLGTMYPTEATIVSDEVLAVKAVLLLQSMRTKLEVVLRVQARGGGGGEDDDDGAAVVVEGLEVAVSSVVRVVYGEDLKEGRMAEWLDGRLGEEEHGGRIGGAWGRGVARLDERLRGKGQGKGRK